MTSAGVCCFANGRFRRGLCCFFDDVDVNWRAAAAAGTAAHAVAVDDADGHRDERQKQVDD